MEMYALSGAKREGLPVDPLGIDREEVFSGRVPDAGSASQGQSHGVPDAECGAGCQDPRLGIQHAQPAKVRGIVCGCEYLLWVFRYGS